MVSTRSYVLCVFITENFPWGQEYSGNYADTEEGDVIAIIGKNTAAILFGSVRIHFSSYIATVDATLQRKYFQ